MKSTMRRIRWNERPHLAAIVSNFGWLLADKALRMAGGILLSVWLARYLGTTGFGVYNYAIAFVALFTPIASLGMNEVVVRDLVAEADSAPGILGTAAGLTLASGLMALAACTLAFRMFGAGGPGTGVLVALFGMTLLLRFSDVVKYWYQSLTASRMTIWIEGTVFIIFFAIKSLLIAFHAPLSAFILALVGEALATSVGLLLLYALQNGGLGRWSFHSNRARVLIGDSAPIVLSGGLVLLCMNLDKVMLGRMSGVGEVGLFSAATRLTEAWYFLPVIIGASIYPRLTRLHALDSSAYRNAAQQAFNLLFFSALAVCFLAWIFSGPVIRLLYGAAYAPAAKMLMVHVWTSLFVFHVSLRTQLLIIERNRRLILAFSSLTLAANFAINLYAIPKAGGIGACYSSLVSWALCALIFPLMFRKSRRFPMQFFPFPIDVRKNVY
ncbi:MAG: flippase [Proteobacteria bacterium]|nr:flippase [Pseudomonadota bacterium]